MRRSDGGDGPPAGPALDWRGWIALAWVLWFGLLYGKMVVERRGQRFRELVPGLRKSEAPLTAGPPSRSSDPPARAARASR
jgi:hypothetical protein